MADRLQKIVPCKHVAGGSWERRKGDGMGMCEQAPGQRWSGTALFPPACGKPSVPLLLLFLGRLSREWGEDWAVQDQWEETRFV